MQQPAIQAALDNLVEVIRTALTAEFLEYFRGGDVGPVQARRPKRTKPGRKADKAKKTPRAKAAKKSKSTRAGSSAP